MFNKRLKLICYNVGIAFDGGDFANKRIKHIFLTEVDQHLFSGWGVKNIIIDTPVLWSSVDLFRIFKVMDVVPERLLVSGKFFIVSVFNEFFFQNIVN